MLDDLTSSRTSDPVQADGKRVALTVRRVAWVVAVPAMLLMLGGLLAYGITNRTLGVYGGGGLPGIAARSVTQLTDLGRPISGEAAMSLGLLLLALAPAITVFVILVNYLRVRRWKEAAVAAAVVAIMACSAILGKK